MLLTGVVHAGLGHAATSLAREVPTTGAIADLPSPTPSGSVATQPAAPSAADRGAAVPVAADGASPVVHYRLEAVLDTEEHRVDGSGEVRWRNDASVAVDELYLHLYLNAFKNDQTVFMRSAVGRGFRGGGRPKRWGWIEVTKLSARELDGSLWPPPDKHTPGDPRDETDIRVPLPRPVEPGETLTLDVEWKAQLPAVTHRTGYWNSFHMVAQWFPKLARLEPDGRWTHFPFHRLAEFYADYGDYDVRIDAPAGFVVGATGKQVEQKPQGERVTRRFVQQRVHDFAFSAWDGFAETESRSAGGVKLRCLYPKGLVEVAEVELEAVRRGLRYYGDAFGEYPYEQLTVVHPPREAMDAGGMEYPTLITTGGRWYAPRLGVGMLEILTVHELGHQWFYGLVGSNELRWPFLDEGLTSYAQTRVMEHWRPGASAARTLGLSLGIAAVQRVSAARVAGHGAIDRSADQFASGSDYGGLVYARTATLLHTLGRVYGDDELEQAIGAYARRHRFGHPTPDDLIQALRRGLGEQAALAMQRGLAGGWVDYAVEALHEGAYEPPAGVFGDPEQPDAAPPGEGEGSRIASVRIRRRGDLELPVDVLLRTEDGAEQRRRWDGRGETHTIVHRGDSPVVAVVVDPDQRVLIDQDLRNNGHLARGRRRLGRGSLFQLQQWVQLLLGVSAP
jgi:hypothetical protein